MVWIKHYFLSQVTRNGVSGWKALRQENAGIKPPTSQSRPRLSDTLPPVGVRNVGTGWEVLKSGQANFVFEYEDVHIVEMFFQTEILLCDPPTAISLAANYLYTDTRYFP